VPGAGLYATGWVAGRVAGAADIERLLDVVPDRLASLPLPAIVVIVPLPEPPNAPVAATTDATIATPTASQSLIRTCLRTRGESSWRSR